MESFVNPHLHLCRVWNTPMMEDEARRPSRDGEGDHECLKNGLSVRRSDVRAPPFDPFGGCENEYATIECEGSRSLSSVSDHSCGKDIACQELGFEGRKNGSSQRVRFRRRVWRRRTPRSLRSRSERDLSQGPAKGKPCSLCAEGNQPCAGNSLRPLSQPHCSD
jgi:hypothetical protein